ncbi:MAG TPA: hypothetical protein VLH16_04285 [Bacteroidales bacterium]|nr:hypothetical protein [Bacteroidales bacterium]
MRNQTMLDGAVVFVVIIGSVIIGGVTILSVRGFWQRLMLLGFLSGLFLYSGIGAAYKEVPSYYLFYYFGFLFIFCVAFWFWKTAFSGASIRSGPVLTRTLADVDHNSWWQIIIWAFLLLHLIPLLYPDFRLHWLLAPPALDIRLFWFELFQPREKDILLKLVEYGRLLLTPFFYIALFRYRQRMRWVILFFSLLLYIQYVVNGGYIGRGTVMMTLMLIGIILWVNRPRHRTALIFGATVLLPVILIASYMHSVVRIGGTIDYLSPMDAIVTTLEQETGFVRNVGMTIIEGGYRAELKDYVKWIVTLPIPKYFTGEIEGARINYEIAEIILGIGRGEKGWTVSLAGLVSESVYLFGSYFFWLHAIFIAFIAALLIRLIERTPQLLFLQAYVVLLFSYVLNRAGIGSLLPIIVNEFLLFYLYVSISVFRLVRKQYKLPEQRWKQPVAERRA